MHLEFNNVDDKEIFGLGAFISTLIKLYEVSDYYQAAIKFKGFTSITNNFLA